MSHFNTPARCILGILALVLATPTLAQEDGASGSSSRAARVDALFDELRRSDAPGGVAAVIQDNCVFYRTAYGMADLERGAPVKARPRRPGSRGR